MQETLEEVEPIANVISKTSGIRGVKPDIFEVCKKFHY